MGDAAFAQSTDIGPAQASWPMRLAQQAFAQLLEDSARHSGFRVGARRMAARETLSALSVDDRGPFERWLSLQVFCAPAAIATTSINVLATVDATLATAVRSRLVPLALELAYPVRSSQSVAA